ncbi:MAG: hypothetical protein JXA66_08285 [Oligoflexia bacterium]|nr:hypothetical protein [Oligoflexia bacterium]
MYGFIAIICVLLNSAFSFTVVNDGSRNTRFLIAEASFIGNDLFRAEKIFRDLVTEKIADDISYTSLDRLIRIAELHGDEKLFRDNFELFNTFKEGSTQAYSSLIYTIGKYFLHNAQYNIAERFLRKIDEKSPYYPRAVYLLAASAGVRGNYKQALLFFDSIISSGSYFATSELKELSVLGRARMFMKLKRYDEALVEYQSIRPISLHYLQSLKEIVWVFFHKRDYRLALSHLEALAFVNKDLYFPGKTVVYDERDTLTDLDLMKLKSMQGYIYMEQNRFEEAMQIFNEILLHYNRIKKGFMEELNRFKLSDDLTQLVSHPTQDGFPRSLIVDFDFTMFGNGELYSRGFREWLSLEEQREMSRNFNLYFSVMKESERLRAVASVRTLNEGERDIIALRNVMNRYLKSYTASVIKLIHARLDDIGLKAQLGRIDIVWKTKENQTNQITDIQENKQQYMNEIDRKFKLLVE